ncbi:MAG TPA: hypothetical protein VD978_36840 [Azospirillum sp.]|nr:hypothetical protein [Azospirillum sp.]
MWTKLPDALHRRRPAARMPAADQGHGHAPQGAAPARSRSIPRRIRGTREAQDAVKAAELLGQPLTLERAEALFTLLAPYRRRLFFSDGGNPLHTLAGQPPGRLHDMAMRHAAPMLLDVLLPACRDHLIDCLVAPAGTDFEVLDEDQSLPSAVDVAAAMRTMVGTLRGGGRQHVGAVIGAVEAASRTMVEQAARTEMPAGTTRGVTMLSNMLLRLEALRLVLEMLGARSAALGEVAYQSRRVARMALRHAGSTLNAYVDNPDLITLHGSLQVIGAVDSLIVVALRILDALEGQEEEETPFVKVTDEVALETYMDSATRLARVLFDLVRNALFAEEFDSLLFAAMLHKIKWLHRFCSRLGMNHSRRPAALDELRDYIVLHSAMLARRTGDWLTDTLPGHPDAAFAHTMLDRADEVAKLLSEMNRRHVQEALTGRIAAVRAVMEKNSGQPKPDAGEPGRCIQPDKV